MPSSPSLHANGFAIARKDQAGQASTGDGAGDGSGAANLLLFFLTTLVETCGNMSTATPRPIFPLKSKTPTHAITLTSADFIL
jgi:hypothetical protein